MTSSSGPRVSPFTPATVARWIARGLSLALFLFWGAFFVEHLAWFGSAPTPPLQVWLLQGAHLALLAGYLLSLKWERSGSAVLAASAIVFFTAAAGSRAFLFIVIGLLPVAFYAYAWLTSADPENHHIREAGR